MNENTSERHTEVIMRGENMTRIETFVAAAFAFAVTMLVISVEAVPQNFEEFLTACKQIPAFAASFAMITWIWYTHAIWSRRYGLEDTTSVVLSSMLIFLVLVYVYPLRVMMDMLFAAISNGYFPSPMDFDAVWQVRFMFGFYAAGLFLLCINFILLYRHVRKKTHELALSDLERFEVDTEILIWSGTCLVSVISLALSITLPLNHLGWAGYSYFFLFPVLTTIGVLRGRQFQRGSETLKN